MKHTASANAISKSNSAPAGNQPGYVMCIDNTGYLASLEIGKVYRSLRVGRDHQPKGWLRVIDESGEDYLFPPERFVRIHLPVKGRRAIAGSSR